MGDEKKNPKYPGQAGSVRQTVRDAEMVEVVY